MSTAPAAPDPGDDESPPDLATEVGYLAALGAALVEGTPPPPPPPALLAAMDPARRAEFDRKVANYYRAAGQPLPGPAGAGVDAGKDPKWPAIAGYEILRHLGEGNQGVVYLARRPHLFERRFAVKVLQPPPGVEAAAWADRALVEVEALCRLDIAGVVRIVDQGVAKDGRPFLAMDYVAGASLYRRIRALEPRQTRPQPIAASARLACQLARIVAECNRKGIYHRDLKPGNVLLPGEDGLDTEAVLDDLDEHEEPVIADFGLAKIVVDPQAVPVSQDFVRFGTSFYMAPEQWDAHRFGAVGLGTDVWALGVILYELLTAQLPFPGDRPGDSDAVRAQVCDGEPRWPRQHRGAIPPGLEAIILKALRPAPADRYRDADALADDLDAFLKSKPVGARRPGTARRLGAWRRRNRRLVRYGGAALTLVVLLAAIGLGLLGLLRGQLIAERARATLDHDALVASARALAQRGDWPGALDAYRRAIGDARDDSRTLRIERLDGLLATNDRAAMRREIAELAPPPGAGPTEARLDLARGMLLLCDLATREAGLAAVRAALASGGAAPLAEADRAYAESLLEATPRAILGKLRAAVALDPFHGPARDGLVLALLTEGRLGEARDEAARLKAATPRATLPDFALILVDLCEGDRSGADRRVDDLAARLGPGRAAEVATLRRHVGHLGNLIDALSRVDPNMPDPLNRGRIALASAAIRAQQEQGLPFDLPVPTLSPLGVAVDELVSASGAGASPIRPAGPAPTALTAGSLFGVVQRLVAVIDNNADLQDEAGFRRIEVANRSSDDALFATLIAMNRFSVAFDARKGPDRGAFDRLMAEASTWCGRGADGPTVLPRSPLRYKCLVVEAAADLVRMKFRREIDPRLPAHLRDNLHRLVADGRRHPAHRRQGLPLVFAVITAPLTDGELADWGIAAGGDRAAYRERCRWLRSYARSLLDDWQADDPTNGDLPGLSRKLEQWSEPNG